MSFKPLGPSDVATETLQKFKQLYNVKTSDAFLLGSSTITDEMKCIGTFVDLDLLRNKNTSDGPIELLRIPHVSTFSIHTILNIINDKSQYPTQQQFEDTISIVKQFLASSLSNDAIAANLSETLVLVVYFVVFERLQQMGYALPAIICDFLSNVLLTTQVGSFYTALPDFKTDVNLELMGQYGLSDLSCVFESLVDICSQSFDAAADPKVVASIMASVISRCLEIPQELEANSDDFQVHTTLVPILDYANHDNQRVNAHFDIDRQTNDLLLYLDIEKCLDKGGICEVFISYDPIHEFVHFQKVYGFSPPLEPDTPSYMNCCLDKKFLASNMNLDLFYKWFDIKPCVQFCFFDGRVYINDCIESFKWLTIPFFTQEFPTQPSAKFFYDEQVPKIFARYFARARGGDAGDFIDICQEQVEYSQQSGSESIDMPQLAWVLQYAQDNVTVRRRLDKKQITELSEYNFKLARDSFVAYLLKYLQWRQKQLQDKLTSLSISLKSVATLELDMITQVIRQRESNGCLFLSDTNLDRNRFQDQPIPPLLATSSHRYSSPATQERVNFEDQFSSTDPQAEYLYYEYFFSP
ncbi:LAFA_0D14884g1_1 [Lachancea sp. 'fantastica']|nr:LAFA_0D14884g1_1 [Lachancea sp. 'fantastica']